MATARERVITAVTIRDVALEHGYKARLAWNGVDAITGVEIADTDGSIVVTTLAEFLDWAGY